MGQKTYGGGNMKVTKVENCTARPWGTYEVLLDADDCKVKRITVEQGQRLSYQYHMKRSEIWVVISGEGTVTLEDEEHNIFPGHIITIGPEQRHRVRASDTSRLVFIEIQRGSYFGEDDIVRISDDYDRA